MYSSCDTGLTAGATISPRSWGKCRFFSLAAQTIYKWLLKIIKLKIVYGSFGEMTTFLPKDISKSNEGVFLTTMGAKSKTFSTPIQFDLDSNGKLTENVPKTYNSSEPLCQMYTGQRCRRHLAGKYVFVQPPYSQKEVEDKLDAAFLVISQSK